MKTARKVLLLALCAVMLVTATITGTLAYLTSTDEVVNTFTVGNVKITMDEAKVNKDGTPIEGADRVQENEYHLLPGHSYTKDPTVHIDAKSEEAYLYIKLVVADNADMKTALEAHKLSTDITTILTGFDASKWTATGNGNGEYFLTYNTTVKGGDADVVVFNKIEMPEEFTNADMETLDELKVTVTAYAIQADGFDTAAEAWTAANSQFTA